MAASQPTLNLTSWHVLLACPNWTDGDYPLYIYCWVRMESRLRTLLGTNESHQFA